jgi:hypothetical protein
MRKDGNITVVGERPQTTEVSIEGNPQTPEVPRKGANSIRWSQGIRGFTKRFDAPLLSASQRNEIGEVQLVNLRAASEIVDIIVDGSADKPTRPF